jgi:hypothetical protein
MPEGSDRFTYREDQDRLRLERIAETQKQTLVQRNDSLKSSVPPLVTTATMRVHEPGYQRSPPPSARRPRTTSKHQHRRLVPEFIAEKREIFLIGLMCGKKTGEMQSMSVEVTSEERDLQDMEARIREMSAQYKRDSAQLEATLARARIATESATKSRMDLHKQYKLLVQSNAGIRAEITKNEDNLERYRTYRRFLNMLTEDKPAGFAQNPQALIAELDALEGDNLFIFDQFEALGTVTDQRLTDLTMEVDGTDVQLRRFIKAAGPIPQFHETDYKLSDSNMREGEQLDSEIQHIGHLIRVAYVKCFGKVDPDVSIMSMLEQINRALERLYVRSSFVDPRFAETKQHKKDEERAEQRRLDTQARKEAEQRQKVEQSLARATKPRKQMTGRPMVMRMLPITSHRPNEAKLRAAMLERQRVETLLFGTETE